MFTGTMTALVTPFRDGKLDEEAYRRLIEHQIAGGVTGIVACGTTGESVTLTAEETVQVFKIAVAAAKKRIAVIAGTGTNDTRKTIEMTRKAKDIGADGVLLVTPYYNKPTQEGVYQHFKAVLAGAPMPAIFYNVPGRTAMSLTVETIARLAKLPGAVGIKDATADLRLGAETRAACPEPFKLLSGDDFTYLPFLAIGGDGCISVTSNVDPGSWSELYRAFKGGDLAKARRLHERLLPLNALLFKESNPIPVKAALEMMGLVGPEIRLPLTPLSEPLRKPLQTCLKELELL